MAVNGILGIKLGMTQVFAEDGTAVPCTVLQAGPCVVTQHKLAVKDGYEAAQIGLVEFVKQSKLTKPAQGLLVAYDDEVPGLAIPTTGGQTARFDNLPNDGFRYRCVFEVAHCQDCANCIKCFHENYFLP